MSDLLFGLDKKTNKYKPMSLTTTADKVLMDLDKNTLLSTEFKTLKDKVTEIGTKVADIPSATEMNKFIKEGENKIVRVNSCTQAISPNIIYLIPSTDPQAPADIKKINRSNVFYYIKVDHISNDEGGIVGLQYAWINGDMSNWFDSDSSYKVRTYSRGFHYYSSYQFTPWRLNAIPIENYVTTFFKGKGTFEYAFGREDITNADNANKPNTMYFLKRGATNSPFPEDDGFIQLEAWNEDGKSYRQIAYSNKSAKRYIRIYRDDAASINWNNGNKYTNWIEDDPSATYVPIIHGNNLSAAELNSPNYPRNYECTTGYGIQIGLPTEFAVIKFFANAADKGYGTQLAFSFKGQEYKDSVLNSSFKKSMPTRWKMLFRSAFNGEWSNWETLSDVGDSWTPKSSLKDLNNASIMSAFTPYYYSTAANGVIGAPPIATKVGGNDDGIIWGYYDSGRNYGFQFAQNWNGGGLWTRHLHNRIWGGWAQIVTTGSRIFDRVFVDGNNEPTNPNGPYISLAVGDSDTGFNRGGNGIFGVVCNGVNTLRFDAQSVIVRPEASKVYGSATVRNTVIATLDPSGGNDGDIWLKYV